LKEAYGTSKNRKRDYLGELESSVTNVRMVIVVNRERDRKLPVSLFELSISIFDDIFMPCISVEDSMISSTSLLRFLVCRIFLISVLGRLVGCVILDEEKT
jgi:hypothetical protein